MKKEYSYVDISGVSFINIEKTEFLHSVLIPRIEAEEKTFVVTANPEIVDRTLTDKAYRTAVKASDYTIADGIGILLAARMKQAQIKERIAGFDLLVDLLKYGDTKGLSIYLLGAEEAVNKKAAEHVQINYPNIKIVGRHHGFFDMKDDRIAKEIVSTQPDLIFVALGMPRQELWIYNHLSIFNKGLFMGVGGSFDVLAGEVKRAPKWWIKLNLEWLYRMIKQPERMVRNLKILRFMVKQLPFFRKN